MKAPGFRRYLQVILRQQLRPIAFARVSLINVGKQLVVPYRRCARAMARIASGVGCIIEKNAAAAIDLQVDEAGRKHRSGRHNFGWPVIPHSRSRGAMRLNASHAAIKMTRIIVPSVSIENAVSRNCQLGSFGRVRLVAGPSPHFPHWPVGRPDQSAG